MASDRATLEVSERSEFGSRASRRLRRQGLIPGVVYGEGGEARAFTADARKLRALLAHGGALFDLVFDGGDPQPVVLKEQQRDPVRGDVLHIDVMSVRLDQKIQAEVPLELVGADDAPGVRQGGVLEFVTHQVTIEALPTDIPETIPVDVSGMEIQDTLTLSQVTPPEGVSFVVQEGVDPDEITIATLSPPRVQEEPTAEVEEEAEVVGEAGAEAEGAEAAGEESGE
jgi:large subunit ribosomal protein L25